MHRHNWKIWKICSTCDAKEEYENYLIQGSLKFTDRDVEELKKQFPTKDIPAEIEAAEDWLLATGKKYRDYKAFMRNWLRRSKDVVKAQVYDPNLKGDNPDWL
jgi:hypothetical protein